MLQVKIDQNLAKFENFLYFDLIWPPVVEIDLQTTQFTFLESASNLQSEKVPYRYVGQFKLLTFTDNFQFSRPRGSPQT
jgi:hypothetical protein